MPPIARPDLTRSLTAIETGLAGFGLEAFADGAGALARAIAVLGDAADLSLASHLAGLQADEASVAANALIQSEILADSPAPRFIHPLVGAAVYEEIPAPDRARAHEEAALLLRRHEQPSGVTAAHLILSPPGAHDWVCDVLADAARASLRAGAPGDAVAYLQRALSEPPTPDRRSELVLSLARATMLVDGPAAEAHLREALSLTTDPEVGATLALELARLMMFMGRVGEGVPIVQEASAKLPSEAGDLRRMLAAAALMAPLFDPTFVPPVELVELGRQLPLEPGLGAKMLAAQSARLWAYDGGRADACSELAIAALDGGDLIRADSVFLSVSAVVVLELADRPEAKAAWEALLRECDLHGSHHTRISIGLFHGYGLARRGLLAEAEASLHDALDAIRDWNGVQGTIHAAAFLGRVLRERGDLRAARAALAAVGTPTDSADEARLWLDSHIALLNAEGRFEEALAGCGDAERRFASVSTPIDTPPQLHRAVALHGLGQRAAALKAAGIALDEARAWGSPGMVAGTLRINAAIEGGPAGLDQLREAIALTTGTPALLELAQAQVALGAALHEAGHNADARTLLREGFDLAGSLGAEVLAARARKALHAAGGRLRSAALAGPESLSAAERRVVERAVAGDTNRAIAETLFVTPKTVELHLSNAYRKLGILGRRDLAAVLGEDAAS